MQAVVDEEKLHTKQKKALIICWMGAILVNLRMVFFAFNPDSAYGLTLAYRLVRGDRLFVDLWEPHQTTALLLALLEKIWIGLTGSTEGIVLWLHLWGMALFGLAAFLMLRLFREDLPKPVLHSMAILFFVLRPKFTNMPDYANLHILLTGLLWMFLAKYCLTRKRSFLFLSILTACLAALAYPANVLLFLPLIVAVFWIHRPSLRQCFTVVLGYGIFFGLFLAGVFVIGKMSIGDFLYTCKQILSSDSHSNYKTGGWLYYRYMVYGVLLCLVIFGISFAIARWKKIGWDRLYLIGSAVAMPFVYLFGAIGQIYFTATFEWCYLLFVMLFSDILLGIYAYRKHKPSKEQSTIYLCGLVISAAAFVNTALLTDLSLISIFGYLPLGLIVSVIPASVHEESSSEKPRKNLFVISVFVMVFAFLLPFGEDASGKSVSLLDVENYIRRGPEKYLAASLNYCNRVKEEVTEWEEEVQDGEAVLVIPGYPYNPGVYLYSESVMANYSATSAPALYEEKLLEYWERFPQKKPTVIAVPCWMGTEDRHCPDWLSDYLDREYSCVKAGTRWNFYR